MTKLITQIFIALSLFTVLTASSAIAKSSSDTELQIFKAQTEAKMDAAKESQQKDLEFHKQLVTSQNERIEQINHQVDWLGHLIALGSLIITLLLILVSYFTYSKAKSDAKSDAKSVAKSVAKKVAADKANSTSKAEVEKWFDENLVGVNKEITDLKNKLQKTTQEVGEHADMAHQNIEESNKKVQDHANQIIAANPLSADSKSTLTETEKQTLERASTSLKDKPEAQYTFDDWNTLAFTANAENNFVRAEQYWKKSAEVFGATDEQIAQALYNQGVILVQQEKYEDGIACYKKIMECYGDSTREGLQEHIGQTLINLGTTLYRQDKLAEAIPYFNQVQERYGDSLLPKLQLLVAMALVNKVATLYEQSKFDEASECCQQVHERYGDSTREDLKALVDKVRDMEKLILGKQKR